MTGSHLNLKLPVPFLLILLIIFSNPLTVNTNVLNDNHISTSQQWPTTEWGFSTPEDQGMNSTFFKLMDEAIVEREYALHGLVVVRNGYIIHESYPDWRYTEDTRHRIFSATKSVGSILIGIAIDKGFISSVNERVIDFFPDYTIENLDDRKERMTIEHLLTMTCGVEWWEWGVPIEDPSNPYYEYAHSANPIQYFLDLPMEQEPGEVWVYNSPSITILSHILYRATGLTPLQFAEEYLFGPLGIHTVYWLSDNFGVECMSGALYLTPREMAKIGYLMSNNGTWNGNQIVSKSWVVHSTSQRVEQPYHPITPEYGYLWWISSHHGFYCAQGRYGQRIYILPEYNILLAFTCHLNDWLIQPWDYYIQKFIIPAVITAWTPSISTTTTTTTTTTTIANNTSTNISTNILFPIGYVLVIGFVIVILLWRFVPFRRVRTN